MSERLSLLEVIEVLQNQAAGVGAAEMHDILHRLVVSSEEMKTHSLFSTRRYARNLVHKSERFEIMIMCWNSGQRSSIHDHAGSLGGLKILAGTLTESVFDTAPNGMIKSRSSVDYSVGAIRVEETTLIHQLSNLQGESRQAISVHIYLPPLVRMNVYSLDDPSVKNVLTQYFSFGSGI